MQLITQTFYILSNALLVPVLLLLLVCFLRTLIQAGRALHEYLSRQQNEADNRVLEKALLEDAQIIPLTADRSALNYAMAEVLKIQGDLPGIAYVAERVELDWQHRQESLRGLVKLGPGLGLMGTLIPLGPALVGLAVGDIQTMSNNLVIAFSTTVLGLFVGLVAGFLASLQRRWMHEDLAMLNLLVERLSLRSSTEQPVQIIGEGLQPGENESSSPKSDDGISESTGEVAHA